MKPKKIATMALLAFVVLSVGYFVYAEMGKNGTGNPMQEESTVAQVETTKQETPPINKSNETEIQTEENRAEVAENSLPPKPEQPTKTADDKAAAVQSSKTSKPAAAATSGAEATNPTPDNAPKKPVAQKKKIIVYYFKTTTGCASCVYIENYTGEALRTGFKNQMDDGTIEWKIVNLDEPEHKHFIQDYQLSFKSVIVAEFEGGAQKRWKNLENVWRLYKNKPAFIAFVQDEVKAYVEGN